MDDAAAFGGATLDGGALVQNWLDPTPNTRGRASISAIS